MAFVMRDEWARDPQSITGAERELDNHFGFYLMATAIQPSLPNR